MSRAALAQITDPSNISRSFASSHDAESLKAAQSLLSDIETAEKEFWQAQSRLSVEEAVSVQDEIIRTKKEVSRLRAWYIACETKLEFIEHFNKPVAEVLLPLDARAIAEQETAVKEAKAAMKEAQARVTKLRSQMRAKARELSSGWTALSEQRTKLTELAQGKENGSIPFEQGGAPRPEELESWRALNQSTASFGHCDPSMLAMMDEAQCRAILEAQLAAMEQLQASALAVGAKIALLEQELPSLKSATARLADQADAMERRDAVDNGACSERALEERLQWYKSMKQILCKLGNVTVEWDGARGQLLLCTEGHALALQFDSEHEKFLRVELRMMASSSDSLTGSVHASNLTTSICTGSSAPVCCVHAPLVSDVIQRAIETQDISYLLSESQQRLKKAKLASDALRQASEKLGQARTVEAHSAVRSSACSSSPSTQRVGRDVEGPCSAVHISSPVSCACTGRPHASTLRLRLQLTPEFPLPKATQPSAPSSVLVSAVAMECAGPCDSKNQQQFCARVKAAANSMANHDIAATVMAVERAVSHTA